MLIAVNLMRTSVTSARSSLLIIINGLALRLALVAMVSPPDSSNSIPRTRCRRQIACAAITTDAVTVSRKGYP